jgi:hypothetical protein
MVFLFNEACPTALQAGANPDLPLANIDDV